MDRIIRVSSNDGDVVLDPFCGCATTMVASEQIRERHWAGIDISSKAVQLVRHRLSKELGFLGQIVVRSDIPRRTDLGSLPSPKTHKSLLYGQQEGHCSGCKEHFQMRHLEVDHIIAKSKGGTDHVENLQLLCTHCNRTKGDRGMQYLSAMLRLWDGGRDR